MQDNTLFCYAGCLDEEINEIQKLYESERNVIDAITITIDCTEILSFVCC